MLQGLKDYVRHRLETIVNLQSADVQKYLPYQPSAAAFLIPRTSEYPADAPRHRGLPIPPKALYQGYAHNEKDYVALGEEHVRIMRDLLAKTALDLPDGSRILDHGCAAGRMIRCLVDLAETCEIWGTDISAQSIYWCKQHLTPPFHFATTTTIPHLPFEDRYFSLIYCGSVFTHMDDLADAWLLELRRILKPGGRAFLTIHDQHTINALDQKYPYLALGGQLRNSGVFRATDIDRFGMVAINRSRNWCVQTFYDTEYFCRMLEPMYRVLSVTPEAYTYQTAIIVERR